MAKSFNKLREEMKPARRKRNRVEADITLLEMTLKEIRQNLTELSQEEVAETLEVTQGRISRLEGQHDIQLSKLREYVRALGGELELRVRLPDDRQVALTLFNQVKDVRRALGASRTAKKNLG